MNKKELPPINIITELEQMEAALTNLAPLLAGYYKELLKSGCPDDLAKSLVISYQQQLLGAAKK